jgi:hypothetical protein
MPQVRENLRGHLRLDPTSCVRPVPARPERPAVVPPGPQGIVSGPRCPAVLCPRPPILRMRMIGLAWRSTMAVWQRRVSSAPSAVTEPVASPFGGLIEHLRQDRAVAIADGGEFHRPDVRRGRVPWPDAPYAIGVDPECRTCVGAGSESDPGDRFPGDWPFAIAEELIPARSMSGFKGPSARRYRISARLASPTLLTGCGQQSAPAESL